jgi:hypothetical protein
MCRYGCRFRRLSITTTSQPVVLGMWPYPEPHDVACVFQSQRSVVQTNPELTRSARYACSEGMDAAGLAAAFCMTRPRGGVHPPAVRGNNARTSGWLGASPFGAASLAEVCERLIGERIETATRDIVLDLAIPRGSIEFRKPRPEGCQFIGGKPPYRIFDFLYTAHTSSLLAADSPAQLASTLPPDEPAYSLIPKFASRLW